MRFCVGIRPIYTEQEIPTLSVGEVNYRRGFPEFPPDGYFIDGPLGLTRAFLEGEAWRLHDADRAEHQDRMLHGHSGLSGDHWTDDWYEPPPEWKTLRERLEENRKHQIWQWALGLSPDKPGPTRPRTARQWAPPPRYSREETEIAIATFTARCSSVWRPEDGPEPSKQPIVYGGDGTQRRG
jgi:hypothetical protein